MKPSSNMVLTPLAHILSSVGDWKSDLVKPLQADLLRLENIISTRGYEILLLDFPLAGSLVDAGLTATKGLDVSRFPSSMGSWDKQRNLFRCLFLEVFQPDGLLHDPLPEPEAVFFLRQVLYLYKKLEVPCPQVAVDNAVKSFFRINESLRSPRLSWWAGPERFDETLKRSCRITFSSSLEEEKEALGMPLLREHGFYSHATLERAVRNLDMVSDFVVSQFPFLDYRDIVPRHGPGAVADLQTGKDKYTFPSWSRRLSYAYDQDFFLHYNEGAAFRNRNDIPPNADDSSGRLLAVPKSYKGPRLITSEPTSHQFLQQGLRRWLLQNLPSHLSRIIDIRDQTKSRDLARLGSKTGSLATVDLSSASDRLSLWTVERMFSRSANIIPYLYASRTVWVTDCASKNAGRGSSLLRMYAGQGNATTFLLQSIVYGIACYAAVLTTRNMKVSRRNLSAVSKDIRVFGDDLIVPAASVPILGLILEYLELKVNSGKTHYQGAFRESCGMDAFDGEDVTPLYLSHLEPGKGADRLSSWIDVSNNAYLKGLWPLSFWMENKLPAKLRSLIPYHSDVLPCLSLTTFTLREPRFKVKRQSKTLHCEEGLGLVPITEEEVGERETDKNLLQFFLERGIHEDFYIPHLLSLRAWKAGYTVGSATHLSRRWVPLG